MNISIVVVTHNRVTALCELLESIAKQSVEPFEVIIVNDAGESVDFVERLYSEPSDQSYTSERKREACKSEKYRGERSFRRRYYAV